MIALIIALAVTVFVLLAAIEYINRLRSDAVAAWMSAELACDVLRADIIEKREELTYATQRYIDENQRCVGALKLLTHPPPDCDDPVGDAVFLLRGDDEDEPDIADDIERCVAEYIAENFDASVDGAIVHVCDELHCDGVSVAEAWAKLVLDNPDHEGKENPF